MKYKNTIAKFTMTVVTTVGLVYLLFVESVIAIFNPIFSSNFADSFLAYVFIIFHVAFFVVTVTGYFYMVSLIWKNK